MIDLTGKAGDELKHAAEEAEKSLLPEAREHMKAWGALRHTFSQLTKAKANKKRQGKYIVGRRHVERWPGVATTAA